MSTRSGKSSGLVYSTDAGRMCPVCRAPVAQCACKTRPSPVTATGPVRVGRQTHGRAGKAVTLIDGLPLDAAALAELAKRLKNACGSGGTVKAATIEIQGDHVDRIVEWLAAQGWKARRTGG